ncbi:hypothetical protein BSZ39_08465 [Bowdeniella nasicola]|uniref:TadE-like domain-containing protein n=1 Tax=Bowdeniella nasicola TaxID=208480 RepID=A0A1Q5Q1S6_9ACTO|nr:TadE family protein [Bowdeniella nasicola]OKL53645.1 hypothetical protein BSZ39_08465 [Bowdeniella nasicola]
MRAALHSERGSVIPEYVMVLTMLLFVLLALIQFVFAAHIHSILRDSAAEGARRAAMMDGTDADGVQLAHELITSAVSEGYASDISIEQVTIDGVAAVRVSVKAPLPVIGLLGPTGGFDIQAHAVREDQFLTTGAGS